MMTSHKDMMTCRLCLALFLIALTPQFTGGCSTQSGARGSGNNNSGDDDTTAGDDDDTTAGDDDTADDDDATAGDDDTADDDDTTAGDDDTADDDDTTPPPVDQLHGTAPAQPLGVPSFEAVNSDGSARSTPDLLGHPTVMWFFPYAGTPV